MSNKESFEIIAELHKDECLTCCELLKVFNDLKLHVAQHRGLEGHQIKKIVENRGKLEGTTKAKNQVLSGAVQKADNSLLPQLDCSSEVIPEDADNEGGAVQNFECIETDAIQQELSDLTNCIGSNGGERCVKDSRRSTCINDKQPVFKTYKNSSDKNISKENVISNVKATTRKSEKTTTKPLKYECMGCDGKFKTALELKKHMLEMHVDLKPYTCETCGQAYKNKNALEIHVGMHNGVRPFQCHYCDKSFTQKVALIRHLPMHTGEAPYQCHQCGKRFIHHTSYNMHLLSHSKKKQYKCDICDKLLFSTSHLKRHQKIHTGEKRFLCSHCGKRFAERYNLVAHQKVHKNVPISETEK